MVQFITLVPLPEDQPSSYIAGSMTRGLGNEILSIDRVKSSKEIGQLLSKGTAAALAAAQEDWSKLGGEAVRLTDGYRSPRVQAHARERYEKWVAAGKPTPGKRGFDELTMKPVYVARVGQSNHGWGGAIDIDVDALYVGRTVAPLARGSDEALAAWWKVAFKHGFTPIISEPNSDQSECWHFDHLGPLTKVYDLYREKGGHHPASAAALAGAALSEQSGVVFREPEVAYIQAGCALLGEWPGTLDGVLGPKTKRALKKLGYGGAGLKPTQIAESMCTNQEFVELLGAL